MSEFFFFWKKSVFLAKIVYLLKAVGESWDVLVLFSVFVAWKVPFNENVSFTHCMKIIIFVLRKFLKRSENHIFTGFRRFTFPGNIIFSELSFKRKCKKAASFRFCTCAFLRKYEIFVIAIHKVEFFCRSYCNENKRFFASPKVNFLLILVKQKDEIFYAVPK